MEISDNTKILETEDMREFKFSIGYISHQIGEEMISDFKGCI